MTIDHVIPASWFPDGTPENHMKWKVPACRECNNRFSRIEKNLLERLGLSLDPKDPIVGSIARKSMRALKPSMGKNPKDSTQRAMKRNKVRAEVLTLKGQPLRGVLPFFGPKPSAMSEEPAALLIPAAELQEFGCKLVRGMLFVTGGHYVSREYQVSCHINTEESDRQYFEPFFRVRGKHYQIAPGLEATIIESDQPPAALFRFKIWNRLTLHGSVLLTVDATRLETDD